MASKIPTPSDYEIWWRIEAVEKEYPHYNIVVGVADNPIATPPPGKKGPVKPERTQLSR